MTERSAVVLTLVVLQVVAALLADALRYGLWRWNALGDPGVLALAGIFPLLVLLAERPRRVVLASALAALLTGVGGAAAARRGVWPTWADWRDAVTGDVALVPLASWSVSALGVCAAILLLHSLAVAAAAASWLPKRGRAHAALAGIALLGLLGAWAAMRPTAAQGHPLLAALSSALRGDDDPLRLRWGRQHDDPVAQAGLVAWSRWRADRGPLTVAHWRVEVPARDLLTPDGRVDVARWPRVAERLQRGALLFPRVVQTGPDGVLDAWARAGEGFPVWQAALAPARGAVDRVLAGAEATDDGLARRLDTLQADPAAASTQVWIELPMPRREVDGPIEPPDRPGAWILWTPGGDWPSAPVLHALGSVDADALRAQLETGDPDGPLALNARPGLRFFWYGRRAGDWGGLDGDWFFVHRAQGAARLIDLARDAEVEDSSVRRLAVYDELAAAWLLAQAAGFDARVGTPAPHRLMPAELSSFGLKRARWTVRAAEGLRPVTAAHPDDALRLELLWFGYPRVQDIRLVWSAPNAAVREQVLAVGDELRAFAVPPPFPAPLAVGTWQVDLQVNGRSKATWAILVDAGAVPATPDVHAEPIPTAVRAGRATEGGLGGHRLRSDDRLQLVSDWRAGGVPWPATYRLISPRGESLDLPFLLPEGARTQGMTLTPPVPLWPGAWRVELYSGAGRVASAGFEVVP